MSAVLHIPLGVALDLDALAHDVALRGPGGQEVAIGSVAAAAERAGACPVLVRVLLDRDAPDIVRARAFGRLATFVAAHRAAPDSCAETDLLCA